MNTSRDQPAKPEAARRADARQGKVATRLESAFLSCFRLRTILALPLMSAGRRPCTLLEREKAAQKNRAAQKKPDLRRVESPCCPCRQLPGWNCFSISKFGATCSFERMALIVKKNDFPRSARRLIAALRDATLCIQRLSVMYGLGHTLSASGVQCCNSQLEIFPC